MAKQQSDFSPDRMRARFAELVDEKAEMEKEIAPLQKQRDRLAARLAAIEAEIRPVNEALKAARQPFVAIDNELGSLSRALGGKTGSA